MENGCISYPNKKNPMDRLKTSVEGKRLSEGESDENSKLPPFQLSGVVCCLTLRKILYSRWNPHLKFSFGLIRGLYKDSIRPQKVQKSKSRTTLKNNSATALEKNIENAGKSLSEKKIGIKTIRTDFVRKSSKLAIFGIHVHRAPMHKVVQIFKKKLSTALFIFKVNGLRHNSFKSALKALTSCAIKARIKSYFSVFSQKPLSPIILITSLNSVLSNLKTSIFFEILKFRAGPNYLKISRIYNTHYLYKLADAFTTWEENISPSYISEKFTQSTSISLLSTYPLLLPPPIDIHEYIDDFYNISKEQIPAQYYCLD